MYASSWFVTLFASTLSLNVVYRIMDAFLVDVSAARPGVYVRTQDVSTCVHTYVYIVTGNTCLRTILLPLDTDDDRVVPFSPAGLASCVQGGIGTAALQLR